MGFPKVSFAAFFCSLVPLCTLASEALSPRILALGGSGESDGTVEEATFSNPSLLPRLPFYAVSFGAAAANPSAAGTLYQAAAQVPAHSIPIPLALGWANRIEGSGVVLGSGLLLGDRASLGFSTSWLQTREASPSHVFNLNLSFSLQLTESWALSLLANSIFDSGFDSGSLVAPPRELRVATRIRLTPGVSTHLSIRSLSNEVGLGLGLEAHVFEYFFLRLGWGYRSPTISSSGTYISSGIGLALPNGALNYAMIYSISETNPTVNTPTHIVGASIYY